MKTIVLIVLAGLCLGSSSAAASPKAEAALQSHLIAMANGESFNVDSPEAATALKAVLYLAGGYPRVVEPSEAQVALAAAALKQMAAEAKKNASNKAYLTREAKRAGCPVEVVKEGWVLRSKALEYAVRKIAN